MPDRLDSIACVSMISAHRGGGEVFPAETYEAFELAIGSGAEYVEIDVRRLRDGTLVCFHDAYLGVPLARMTYPELCARARYEVPLVSAVLRLMAGRSRGHIDLKEIGHEAEVVGLAMDVLGPDGFVVTTMEDQSLRAIAREFPQAATALSLGRGIGDVPWYELPVAFVADLFPAGRIRTCRATWVSMNVTLVPWVLPRCVRLGLSIMVWTVDRTDQIDRLLADPRVDVLVTNRPLFALERRAGLPD